MTQLFTLLVFENKSNLNKIKGPEKCSSTHQLNSDLHLRLKFTQKYRPSLDRNSFQRWSTDIKPQMRNPSPADMQFLPVISRWPSIFYSREKTPVIGVCLGFGLILNTVLSYDILSD